MSTVKISQLEEITHLNSNTSNTLIVGVDIPSGVTGKITATTLAHGLYQYHPLNVGNNPDEYPNTIAQFAGTSNNYIQVNLENIDNDYGTADYVVGANTGSDTTLYLDMGFANKQFDNVYSYNGLTTSLYPLDGYLYVMGNTAGQPGGNLVIGTASAHREIRFIAEGTNTENIVVRINSSELSLRNNAHLKFTDDTVQTTAGASNAYSMAAYAQANTNASNLISANNWLQANDVVTLSSAFANDTTTLASAKSYTDSANSWLTTYVNTGPAYLRANAAYLQANNAYDRANTAIGDFNVLNTEVGALTTLTLLVGGIANTALQNTSGIFAGNLTITGNTVVEGSITLKKGAIYTANVNGTVATRSVDFGRDSLIKFDVNTDATITLSNYVAGKIVEVWITNSAAQNKVITHGCFANNSTSKATTFTIAAQSCAFLKYFSIDGDQQNTYVSITA